MGKQNRDAPDSADTGSADTGSADTGSAGAAETDLGALILDVVDSIPPGTVLTYGDVAALLGSRAARFVGTVLRQSGGDHPWWRVVRAGGHPPRGLEAIAHGHYLTEKTPLIGGSPGSRYRVDYAVARWVP